MERAGRKRRDSMRCSSSVLERGVCTRWGFVCLSLVLERELEGHVIVSSRVTVLGGGLEDYVAW